MSKKALYSFVALILAAALVIACGVGSSWFTNWNIKTWFNSWGQSQKQPDTPATSVKSNFQLTPDSDNEFMQLSAAFMSAPTPHAENSYTLTAQINPFYADVQTVIWSVQFADSSAEWANGKQATDYVTVTEDGNSKLTVRVDCLEPFGEQIKVRVTSMENAEVYAECLCDYVQRVQNIVFSNLLDFPSSSFTYSFDTTAYTLPADITINFNRFELDDDFLDYIYNAHRHGGESVGLIGEVDYVLDYVPYLIVDMDNKTLSVSRGDNSKDFAHIFALFIGDTGSEDGPEVPSNFYEVVNRNFNLAVKNYNGTHANIGLDFVSSYNGVTYGTYSGRAPIRFNYDSVKVPVTSLTLDNDHIVM